MLKHSFISLFAAGSLTLTSGAPSIGFVKSVGEFRVEGSSVRGNSNLFEGNLVETASTRSVIQLAQTQVTLAPESRVRIYQNRTVLEKGSSFVKGSTDFVIEAATLRIVPLTRESVVQVDITGPAQVNVVSRGGSAEVRNSSGILTAKLLPGMALAFAPQSAPASAVKMIGIVESHDSAYFLTDETTKINFQLEGTDVQKYVGKRVEISGSSVSGANPVANAAQVVRPVTIKPAPTAAGAGSGAGAGGGAAAGAGSATGLSAVSIGAIVGGVAVAGTLGGLAAAGSFSDEPSVSRR